MFKEKMKFLILFPLLIFVGCVSQPKVERDAHDSIIREDPFVYDKLYKKNAEDARKSDSFGVSQLSKTCSGVPVIGDVIDGVALFSKCQYEFLVRLKIQCEFTQVVGQPFYRPVRYKELKINIVNFDKTHLKDQKRFPTNVTTDQNGVIDFTFGTTGDLKGYQIEITDPKSQVTVSTNKISDPISAPESFCSKD